MSADENTDIRVSADNSAALTALEQIAVALAKIGDQGEKANRKNKDSSTEAADGLGAFVGKMNAAEAAGWLADKAFEAVNKRLEEMKRLSEEAFAAQQKIGSSDRHMAELLRPGDISAEAATNQAREIAKRHGIGVEVVEGAAASLLRSRGDKTTVSDVLGNVDDAIGSFRDQERIASTARTVEGMRREFPEFTQKGARAELYRHGFSDDFSERRLQAMKVLHRMTGGKDSYQFLDAFTGSMGKYVEAGGEERAGLEIKKMTAPFLGDNVSIEKRLDFLQHDQRGQNAVRTHLGALDPNQASVVAKALGLRNPAAIEPFSELLRGRGPAAQDLAERRAASRATNDPSLAAEMDSTGQATSNLPLVKASEAKQTREAQKLEWLAKNPSAMKEEARAEVDRALADAGYSDAGVLGLGGVRRQLNYEMNTMSNVKGRSPKDIVNLGIEGLQGIEEHDGKNENLESSIDYLKKLVEVMERIEQQNAEPKETTVRSGGEAFQAQTAAPRAGK